MDCSPGDETITLDAGRVTINASLILLSHGTAAFSMGLDAASAGQTSITDQAVLVETQSFKLGSAGNSAISFDGTGAGDSVVVTAAAIAITGDDVLLGGGKLSLTVDDEVRVAARNINFLPSEHATVRSRDGAAAIFDVDTTGMVSIVGSTL